MPENKSDKYNLFIYGSLRDAKIFQSVSGYSFTQKPAKLDEETLYAEPAFLSGYRKVTPDNVYYYAVSSKTSRIEGLLVHGISEAAMAEIDFYEGKRYKRDTVSVHTGHGQVSAQAYLASTESMRKHFGDRFHVNLIHELWLRKRIERFIKRHTRPGERTVDADIERRADRALLSTTERDLVMSHYRSDAVSDYFLEHELQRPRPSIIHLYDDENAKPFIRNYLAFAVKLVLVNELDELIQSHFRFEVEHLLASERYFKRSTSLLVALQIVNRNRRTVKLIIDKCLDTMPYRENDLIDYIKYAIRAADGIFDRRIVESMLNRIHSNLQPGLVPMGAELELSNLGFAAVEPQRSKQNAFDPLYDGFRYFQDFRLDILSWKLGGYVDDHSGSTTAARRCGFLELAPGRLNVAGELSRPLTADPWLLNQIIHELAMFHNVRPHSLHISFQLRRNQIGKQQPLPLGFVKCLLVLGGGPEKRKTGRLWVSRMAHDEIKQFDYGEELVFARTSKRNWYLGRDDIANKSPKQAITYTQQYKFIRLQKRANYEPLIMCLKGLQLAYNPSEYLTVEQLSASPKLRREYEQLKAWSLEPTEISSKTISRFLNAVKEGLMTERHRKPAHKLHYIDWALNAIDVQLRMFNQQLTKKPLDSPQLPFLEKAERSS